MKIALEEKRSESRFAKRKMYHRVFFTIEVDERRGDECLQAPTLSAQSSV